MYVKVHSIYRKKKIGGEMFVMNLKTCSKPQKMITIKTFMKVLKVCVILKGCKIIMQNRNKVFKHKIPILHLKLQMEWTTIFW